MEMDSGGQVMLTQMAASIEQLRVGQAAMQADLTRTLVHMEQLDSRSGATLATVQDHEARIRVVEARYTEGDKADLNQLEGRVDSLQKFRWMLVGAMMCMQFLGMLLEYLYYLHH